MEIVKGRVTYKDTYDNLIEIGGYVTCGCNKPQAVPVKAKETVKKSSIKYICENCGNVIVVERDRRKKGKHNGNEMENS